MSDGEGGGGSHGCVRRHCLCRGDAGGEPLVLQPSNLGGFQQIWGDPRRKTDLGVAESKPTVAGPPFSGFFFC